MMVVSLSASLVYRKAKKIDWPLALLLESTTMLGSFAGGVSSASFSGAMLSGVFAAVVAVAAVFMIRPLQRDADRVIRRDGSLIWHRCVGEQVYGVHLGLALPLSFVAGFLSGLVGVGGGVLKVPMMVLLFGVPLDIAIGSSALMIGLTAAAGFAGHLVNGHWDWKHSLALAVAVFLGGQIGSRISVRLDKQRLQTGFGWFLFLVAALMCGRLIWGG